MVRRQRYFNRFGGQFGRGAVWRRSRAGHTLLGREFQLELGSAPGWVGALVAVVAFYALEPRASVGSR